MSDWGGGGGGVHLNSLFSQRPKWARFFISLFLQYSLHLYFTVCLEIVSISGGQKYDFLLTETSSEPIYLEKWSSDVCC